MAAPLRLPTLLGLFALFFATVAELALAQCSDVHVVYARGSTEAPGLGITGVPLVAGLKANLPGKSVTSYAVVYGALIDQSSAGAGATDMTRHIVQYAASCPNAVFVIGGYSQGASVTDIAIGIKTLLGTGEVIPTSLAPRIKAVVTFGNPLRLFFQTIASASPLYAAKSIDYCNLGDPVCNAGLVGPAHLTYHLDGSVTAAAYRAAVLVRASSRNLRA